MSSSAPEPEQFSKFRIWAKSNGAFIHSALKFVPGPRGTSVWTTEDIPPNTTVLSCPFDLAITRDLALGALKACIWDASQAHRGTITGKDSLPKRVDQLSERQLVCAYIVLHWVILTDSSLSNAGVSPSAKHLRHAPYIDTLPPPDQLRTPLQFTPEEFQLLKGTNLYGATEDRKNEWQVEWKHVRDILADADDNWGDHFTWERYLTAATYLSSRAFPSTLLSSTVSDPPSPEGSYPVLLPVLDCLDHARAHPVSWVVTSSPPSTPTSTTHNINKSSLHITLVERSLTSEGTEVLNNYGPKPNAELLLGYGFVIPSNPEDTIVLKLGGSVRRHEIGRAHDGELLGAIQELWSEVETMVLTSGEDDESVTSMEGGWEVTLEVCESLQDLVTRKIDALPNLEDIAESLADPEVRPDVRTMIVVYVQGQRDVLDGILDYVEGRKREAIDAARASGLDVQEDAIEEEE